MDRDVENVSRQMCNYAVYMCSLANEPEKVTMRARATSERKGSGKGVVAPLVCINLGNTGWKIDICIEIIDGGW